MIHSSKKAQVVLEYVAIATLVMLTVLILGPYTVRSINAFFMFSEDSIKDSTSETFRQEGSALNMVPPGCTCTAVVDMTCGAGGCETNELLRMKRCDPTGCEPEKECVVNNGCCETTNMGCWSTLPNGIQCGGSTRPTTAERQVKIKCGNIPETYSCQFDSLCDVKCNPTTAPANTHFCANTLTNLGAITNVSYIAATDNCAAQTARCVAQCNPDYILDATSTACIACGNGFCDNGTNGRPNLSETCASTSCPQDCGRCPPTCMGQYANGTSAFNTDPAFQITCQNDILEGVCVYNLLGRGYTAGNYACTGSPTNQPYCDWVGNMHIQNRDGCGEDHLYLYCENNRLTDVNRSSIEAPSAGTDTKCLESGAWAICDGGGGNDPNWGCDGTYLNYMYK